MPHKALVLILLAWLSCCSQSRAQKPVQPETVLDESNSWAFVLPDDAFGDDAVLDLRNLNERQSGQSGFVRLSADHNSFVRGDGEPLRFWIVGTDGHEFSPKDMDIHARWLAKLGVNMVRLHVTVCRNDEGSKITDLNEELIDGVFRFIKSAKDNGIYVLISPYYAHFDAPQSWQLPGGEVDMEGLIFIDEKVQNAYKHWTKELYTRTNPHTGLSIANDPTVAVLQILNEDSLLFWSIGRLRKHHRKILAAHFSSWLVKKYGSVDTAWERWGDGFKGRDPLDDLENGTLACVKIYELTTDAKGAYGNRLNDTAQFIAEFQRDFYAEMGRYLREDLGCKQLLNATNWRTANDDKLKALERYSYHALDIDAENEYVGSDFQHSGNNANYRIDPGHFLVNESVLPKPLEMCTNWRQEDGHPFIATETAWKNPNRYQSEGPFLASAYLSLSGVDGVAWFSCQTPRYETNPLKSFWRIGDQLSIYKWSHSYPAMMAGFPANALLYRRGDIKRAAPIVTDVRSTESIFRREVPAITDNETHGDQRRVADLQPGWKPRDGEVNRAAFLIGPVVSQTVAAEDAHATTAADLSRYFDADAGTINSSTGELHWDYRHEFCTMDAPRAQGVTGFLKRNGGRFALSDVTIKSENEYATVNVVSLDGAPIGTSEKVLAQVVTVNRLTGYRTKLASFKVGKGDQAYEVEGEQIVRIGELPIRIANTQVSLEFQNKRLKFAQPLDINGYRIGQPMTIRDGIAKLPEDAIYVVLASAKEVTGKP